MSEFYRILRSNVNSRSICLSMDLSPDLIRTLLPELSVRGMVFEFITFKNEIPAVESVTGRLLFNKNAFPALSSINRDEADLDSLRNHYRFVAVDFMRRAGNRLSVGQKERLLSLIRGPFSTLVLDAEIPEAGSDAGANPEP
jgi:hypothetical protein